MRHWLSLTLVFFVAITFAVGCASGLTQTPQSSAAIIATEAPLIRPANVESIEIYQSRGSILTVSVNVRGVHESRCEQIDKIQQSRVNRNFLITIESRLAPASNCASDSISFEQPVTLDVNGLPPGTYFVDVNGLRGSFTILVRVDSDPENAVIGGTLWLDSCPENLVTGGVDNSGAGICVEREDGSREANGIYDTGESGIGNVIVTLGTGECYSSGLASTITDNDGVFLFAGLSAGKYCVSIDSMNPQNSQQLFEGHWSTAGFGAVAEVEFDLQESQIQDDINFGWQHTLQPQIFLPREDPCTNKALFIEDVSIPDGTILFSGQVFTKTWRLRNIGSCSWDEDYALVLVEGEPMDAPEIVEIPDVVSPGDDIELSVTMTAPTDPGVYEAAWKLQNQEAVLFGVGPGSNQAFWVKVIVESRE